MFTRKLIGHILWAACVAKKGVIGFLGLWAFSLLACAGKKPPTQTEFLNTAERLKAPKTIYIAQVMPYPRKPLLADQFHEALKMHYEKSYFFRYVYSIDQSDIYVDIMITDYQEDTAYKFYASEPDRKRFALNTSLSIVSTSQKETLLKSYPLNIVHIYTHEAAFKENTLQEAHEELFEKYCLAMEQVMLQKTQHSK